MKKVQPEIPVVGCICEIDGRVHLKINHFTIPLNSSQLLTILFGKPQGRCTGQDAAGVQCMKSAGHEGKHHYRHKVFKKSRKVTNGVNKNTGSGRSEETGK